MAGATTNPTLPPSVLSRHGYGVLKSAAGFAETSRLRRALTVSPRLPKGFGPAKPRSWPVYRESSKRLYLPRHYGLKNLGPAAASRVGLGVPAPRLVFEGSLRPLQLEAVAKFESTLGPEPDSAPTAAHPHGGILSLACGQGKCLKFDTPIMMADGRVKMVQDVRVGDALMGDDSTPRTVRSLARGRETMYRVVPTKGDPYVVNESHILSLKSSTDQGKRWRKNQVYDLSVKEYLALPPSYHGRGGPLLGYRVPVRFPAKPVDLDPYALGLWLGDGTSRTPSLTSVDPPVTDYWRDYATRLGLGVRRGQGRDAITHHMTSGTKGGPKRNTFLNYLRKYDLVRNKHVPHLYKCNSREVQLAVLAGIIDTDGCLVCNGYDIVQKNERLLDDIIFMARSLGFAAYKKECKKWCLYKGEKREGTYYRTLINGPGLEHVPVRLKRKRARPRRQIKDVLKTRIRLEKLGVDDYYGFEIDGNRRFLLGDFTVTHNTVCALYLASRVKRKTLVVVHKEFLLHQWHERIRQFLPNARVGLIQQKKVDVKGKDIVLAMLQSLSVRDYPAEAMDQFGMVISDEAHHLSSEMFCRALPKIGARVTLGLSATPKRADGLSKVFEWYLGAILFKSTRERDARVTPAARVVHIDAAAAGYGEELVVRYTGNVNSAGMINRIAGFAPRTALVAALARALVAPAGRQVLLLSGRRQHLEDIHGALLCQGAGLDADDPLAASIGYYVGGMNQDALKASESCRVVLATYTMAAEGLDIKTLNTLLLVTPMSNVTQAVGRVLRKIDPDLPPLVVDVADEYSVFARQAQKRRRVYKKEGFLHITDADVTGDPATWVAQAAELVRDTAAPPPDPLADAKKKKRTTRRKRGSKSSGEGGAKKAASDLNLLFGPD